MTGEFLHPNIADFVQSCQVPHDSYPDEPFASDMRAGKGTSFYRAHTYHTKVPPQGIEAFIAHYTRPGQVVLVGTMRALATAVRNDTIRRRCTHLRERLLRSLQPVAGRIQNPESGIQNKAEEGRNK